MKTSNRPDPGWHQFSRMFHSGVPHAVDIASGLSGSSLLIPSAPRFDPCRADLCFYGPVHLAYRQGVLTQFLRTMEALKATGLWQNLRTSRGLQLQLVVDYLDHGKGRPENVSTWLAARLHDGDIGHHALYPLGSPRFAARRDAA